MAEKFVLKEPVVERPLEDWSTIAVEYLGAQSEIIQGKKWQHRVIHKGDGPPLLMYHGVGGHAETYARTLPAIAAAGYHVFAVDALFHGYSSKEGFPSDRSQTSVLQAEAVVDLIDALGYEKASYEGESMGAGIGFEFGMRFPEHADKIILNGFGSVKMNTTFPPSKGNPASALWPLSVAAVTDPTYDNVAKRLHWLVHPDHPERITDEMVRIRQRLYQDPAINASMRNVFTINTNGGQQIPQEPRYTEDDVKNWKPDCLVLWGEFNPGSGPDYGEYAAGTIGAKFYEFKDAGHWPQWEKPDEYAQVMIQYLNS